MTHTSGSWADGAPDADVVDRDNAGERAADEAKATDADVVVDYETEAEWDAREDVKAAKAQRAEDLKAQRENPDAPLGRASNPAIGGE